MLALALGKVLLLDSMGWGEVVVLGGVLVLCSGGGSVEGGSMDDIDCFVVLMGGVRRCD